VFVGGCDLHAAEAAGAEVGAEVGAAPGTAGVLNVLTSLVEKSLLQRSEAPDGEPRFVMFETIREYVLERLEERGEAPAARRRHAAYYLDLAGQAESGLSGTRQAAWLERLEQERGNLQAALSWSVEVGEGETATRLGAAVWRAERSIAVYEASLAFFRRLTGAAEQTTLAGELGRLVRSLGAYTRATVLHEDQLVSRDGGRGAPGIAAAILELGSAIASDGNLQQARVLYRGSLALSRELGDRAGTVLSLEGLAHLAEAQGRGDRATCLRTVAAALGTETSAPSPPGAPPAHSGAGTRPRSSPGAADLSSPLTPRERDVVRLIAQGLGNRQIADELVIARGTADRHVANILGKLELTSRTQVAVWAVEHGLLIPADPPP
jgi:DNA-binding CsgD family transcriptional regulator